MRSHSYGAFCYLRSKQSQLNVVNDGSQLAVDALDTYASKDREHLNACAAQPSWFKLGFQSVVIERAFHSVAREQAFSQ